MPNKIVDKCKWALLKPAPKGSSVFVDYKIVKFETNAASARYLSRPKHCWKGDRRVQKHRLLRCLARVGK